MSAGDAKHPATRLIDRARQLLATLPADSNAWPPLRWIIRPTSFDAYRQYLEDSGALKADVAAPPPTLFGIPYDFGYPNDDPDIALMVSPTP